MNKKIVLSIIGGVFLLAAALLVVSFFSQENNEDFLDKTFPTTVNTNQDNQKTFKPDEYQANLQRALAPYWKNGDSTGVKDQLLALTTPSSFLDLHLDLVIAFELIEQGQNSNDQNKVAEAKTKLDNLKVQYPWIANY